MAVGLARYRLQGSLCPGLLCRVAGFLAQKSIVPRQFDYGVTDETATIEICLSDVGEREAAILFERFRGLIAVSDGSYDFCASLAEIEYAANAG